MVNRSIQAKILKMKRKGKKPRYSKQVVNSGHVSRATGFPGYDFGVDPTSKYWDIIFPPKAYTPTDLAKRETHVPGWRIGNPVPRADVLKKLKALTEGQDPDQRIVLLNHPMRRMEMMFNSEKNCIYFIEINIREGVVRKSFTFNNMERAKKVYLLNKVEWKEEVPLPA